MKSQISDLLDMIDELQGKLEAEFSKRRAELNVRLEKGKVVFESEIRQRHREMRVGFWEFISRTRPNILVVAPVTYSLIVPLILLDAFVSIYQAVCFPLLGVEKVRRSEHMAFDRHHLGYLTAEVELSVLLLCQWPDQFRAGNRRENRAVLVSDQTRAAGGRRA